MNMLRQGDVLLIQVDSIPQDAQREKGPIILAHGEATGHAHKIKLKSARIFQKEGQRFLRVPTQALLEHEEHTNLYVPAGDYEVIIQREYSPEAIRNVAD